jgi:hypothetical protein
VEIAAVVFQPHIQVMNELTRLPSGSRVGLTCVTQRSTESFFNETVFSGGSSLVKMRAGQDNPEALRRMIDQCQVIFATGFVYDRIRSLAGPHVRVIKVDLTIDRSNIEFIRERIILARTRK